MGRGLIYFFLVFFFGTHCLDAIANCMCISFSNCQCYIEVQFIFYIDHLPNSLVKFICKTNCFTVEDFVVYKYMVMSSTNNDMFLYLYTPFFFFIFVSVISFSCLLL